MNIKSGKIVLVAGDVIVVTGWLYGLSTPDVTIGKQYTIEGGDDAGDAYFTDDMGDANFCCGEFGDAIFDIVINKNDSIASVLKKLFDCTNNIFSTEDERGCVLQIQITELRNIVDEMKAIFGK